MSSITPSNNGRRASRWYLGVAATLVLIPVVLNAVTLFPELSLAVPDQNDGAMHFLFIQRASEALAEGYNPFDFWVPDLGYGFPQFHYYQHLPHLVVVLIHRILLKQLDLLTVFNLVRYLLLVGFPITVYWSMRTMEFSPAGSAASAAFCTLMTGTFARMGFEYESYLWAGFGMYTQLWAMHLLMLWLACLQRLLRRGVGYFGTIITSSALVLSHPFYGYMAAATGLAVIAVNLHPGIDVIRRCAIRLGVVVAVALVISWYFSLPFLLLRAYFNLAHEGLYSPALAIGRDLVRVAYHPKGPHRAHLAMSIEYLLSPRVLTTTIFIVGGLAGALALRTRQTVLAGLIFLWWTFLYLAPILAPRLVAAMPMHDALDFRRFIGGINLGAILLVGVASEWMWVRCEGFREPARAIIPAAIVLILLAPQLHERWRRNLHDAAAMESALPALAPDSDFGQIVARLKSEPPARVHFPKLEGEMTLAFFEIPSTYGGQAFSLNSMLPLDQIDATHCNIFNVGYLVLPAFGPSPTFLSSILQTNDLNLYRTDAHGYAEFGSVRWGDIEGGTLLERQQHLRAQNFEWLRDGDAAAGKFIRWNFPEGAPSAGDAGPGTPESGTIIDDKVSSQRIDVTADARQASTLIFKMSYHPNWHVAIDGREAPGFMVSPSYLAVVVPSGHHQVTAEYRSSGLKKMLLVIGALTLLMVTIFRARLGDLERFFERSELS